MACVHGNGVVLGTGTDENCAIETKLTMSTDFMQLVVFIFKSISRSLSTTEVGLRWHTLDMSSVETSFADTNDYSSTPLLSGIRRSSDKHTRGHAADFGACIKGVFI